MTRLFLMRHGNTFETGEVPIQIGARTDLPLTAFGRAQAEKMAQYLLGENIRLKAIYAGPLKRQTESAQIIAKLFALPFFDAPALMEIDYGAWEGLSSEEIARRFPKEYAAWSEGIWQEAIFAQSRQERLQAIENWFEHLRKTHRKEDAILGITSQGILRLLRNEKVKTGHFSEIFLLKSSFKLQRWNIDPQYGGF